jgi:hypothetical protein
VLRQGILRAARLKLARAGPTTAWSGFDPRAEASRMSKRPPPTQGPHRKPDAERRTHADAPVGSLRHLKGLLGRPIGLERRDGQLHVVLVERRRSPRTAQPALEPLRAELRARLLTHGTADAARVMRHLVFVHDELGRGGWRGVEALPAPVLARALAQAEMLASAEASAPLSLLVDRLRLAQAAAGLREERAARLAAGAASLEVSETTQEAFDEVERSWVGTFPPIGGGQSGGGV